LVEREEKRGIGGEEMYTPRGELHEGFLEIMYQEDIWKEIRNCRNREELQAVLDKYVKGMELAELKDTLVVIQSYLEEEQRDRVLSEADLDEVAGGMRNEQVFFKNKIFGLLERHQGITQEIRDIFGTMNFM
jgi:uncharacterized protein YeeX (DUF496 family)